MIVSSVTGSSVQSNNTAFKAIRQLSTDYTSKQKEVMNDIKVKMALPMYDDARLLSMDEKLEQNGYDTYLSSSIIKDDAIDVYVAKKNKKIISVGTYSDYEFRTDDIEESIDETRKIDKIAYGFILGVAMTAMAICFFKACQMPKPQQKEISKVLIQDSMETSSKPVKKLFDKTV